MICTKNLRFSSRLRAKVIRRQGPLSSAGAQPCMGLSCNDGNHQLHVLVGFIDLFVRTPLQSINLIETETKIQESILRAYMYIYHVTEMKLFLLEQFSEALDFRAIN